jgi:hypothetical protein
MSIETKDIFQSFAKPKSPGLYCCFAFKKANSIFLHSKSLWEKTWFDIYRTIELSSILPAYDYYLDDC